MANPVSIAVDERTSSIFVLFDDGSVDTIRSLPEPHDPEPEWQQIAPPNPKALIERVIGWEAEDGENGKTKAAPGRRSEASSDGTEGRRRR